jgi:nicotinamide riboside kinase
MYILCKPDIEWEPDPLRENPHDRDELFELYEGLLRESGSDYVISAGSMAERLQNALNLIEKYS